VAVATGGAIALGVAAVPASAATGQSGLVNVAVTGNRGAQVRALIVTWLPVIPEPGENESTVGGCGTATTQAPNSLPISAVGPSAETEALMPTSSALSDP
jgi:hypothetical protein